MEFILIHRCATAAKFDTRSSIRPCPTLPYVSPHDRPRPVMHARAEWAAVHEWCLTAWFLSAANRLIGVASRRSHHFCGGVRRCGSSWSIRGTAPFSMMAMAPSMPPSSSLRARALAPEDHLADDVAARERNGRARRQVDVDCAREDDAEPIADSPRWTSVWPGSKRRARSTSPALRAPRRERVEGGRARLHTRTWLPPPPAPPQTQAQPNPFARALIAR